MSHIDTYKNVFKQHSRDGFFIPRCSRIINSLIFLASWDILKISILKSQTGFKNTIFISWRIEKEREKEDYEAQTDPGNGLTWDEMIPKDHSVAPSWVECQERQQMEMNLPWRCDPEGTTIWQRDPSPRWRIQEEWAKASSTERDGILKYKLVRGPGSSLPGQDVHPCFNNGNGEGDGCAATTVTDIEHEPWRNSKNFETKKNILLSLP